MSLWKRILLFLAVFVLMLCAVSLPFLRQLPSWAAALKNSWNDRPYQMAACGADTTACAARTEKDGSVSLRFFDPTQPKLLEKWGADLPEAAEAGEICLLYPSGTDCAFLGFYEDNAQHLSLYRVQEGQDAERIMNEDCVGDNAVARKQSLSFSSVTQEQDKLSFVLLTEDTVRALSYSPDTGISVDSETARNGALSAVCLPNTVYMGDSTQLELTFTGSGVFYVDGTDLNVYYGDMFKEKAPVEVIQLDGLIGEHQLTSLSLMQDGSTLLLLDGHILQLAKDSGVQDLTDMLFLDRNDCIIRAVALLASALILSLLLWWQMVVRFQRRLPVALYWGAVSFALFALAIVLFSYGVLGKDAQGDWMNRRTTFAGDMVNLAMEQYEIRDDTLSNAVSKTAEAAGEDQIRKLRVVPAHWDGQNWFLSSGIRAELDPGVNVAFLDEARDQGSAAGKTGDRFWYCLTQENDGLILSFLWDEINVFSQIQRISAAVLAALSAAVLLILLAIGHDVKVTSRGLERYAKNQTWKQIRVSGGDELEGIVSTLNSLAAERAEAERQRERLVTSYRRFVPEEILKLLGKQTVLEVDKNTLASRRMAMLQVRFAFPDPLYTSQANTRLLFESVNQVIERTASIVRQKGGTVFNYAYDGYDVVMEQDPRQAVSAAVSVRQAVLALNEQRAQDGLPTVTLRIAMDVGEVIMGIVGDQAQLEPVTLSDSFATLKELIGVCHKIEANILCTEELISGTEGYGSRYLGKCVVGQDTIRTYEVFDGDPYDVRKAKEAGVRRFTEGVLSLYSGEIDQAKRIFLELVRDAPGDVGARYYLFMADSLTAEDALNGLSLNGKVEIVDE